MITPAGGCGEGYAPPGSGPGLFTVLAGAHRLALQVSVFSLENGDNNDSRLAQCHWEDWKWDDLCTTTRMEQQIQSVAILVAMTMMTSETHSTLVGGAALSFVDNDCDWLQDWTPGAGAGQCTLAWGAGEGPLRGPAVLRPREEPQERDHPCHANERAWAANRRAAPGTWQRQVLTSVLGISTQCPAGPRPGGLTLAGAG